ncbi:predicted RNA-binding protein of the translin family [Longilinea arvoryzae]|uniref:Predicted RNA-binding protein of the translin family n=1 Tax=Longilinea arvoryzae TaxID=360412 RepID=A0A0S7BFS5_9CHLR|nr:haloacid dehalogenase [Longilinea arvoryzae]GAP12314.1 predicted RNA-binding protein of the translin family [Longilinea arvoryzae]
MDFFADLSEQVHADFEARNLARDQALVQARALTRHAAQTIRAIHRSENDLAHDHLREARALVDALKHDLAAFPDLYYAGYTQDAIKEYAEASLTVAVIENQSLPMPADLGIEYNTYLKGLAEVTGELRRKTLDILRQGYSPEAERLLTCMDEIYALLITVDYPDAITNGLRRQTDLVRGIVERTRGDMTISLREQRLREAMQKLAARLPDVGELPEMGDFSTEPSQDQDADDTSV